MSMTPTYQAANTAAPLVEEHFKRYLAEARRMGAVTIGICCVPDAELSRAVEIPIAPLVGPEIVAGSTRMKAGTAQKMVLNMLSTETFIRLGYVYGNLMVNVQPTNHKLIERARRIIAQGTGVSQERAAELLTAAGHRVIGRSLVRDDPEQLRDAIGRQLANPDVQVVVTTGGTGITSRDCTFEAVSSRIVLVKTERSTWGALRF